MGAGARSVGTWIGMHHRALPFIADEKWADEALRITDIFKGRGTPGRPERTRGGVRLDPTGTTEMTPGGPPRSFSWRVDR